MLYRLSYRAKWRSRRGSNPRSPPWQGGVLNHFTTEPLVAEVGIEPTTFRLWAWRATTALLRDIIFLCKFIIAKIKIFVNFFEIYLNKKIQQILNFLWWYNKWRAMRDSNPREFYLLTVFKTVPFSQTWVIALFGSPSWDWTSDLTIISRVL
ncbi:hypothetical protein MMOB3820 [Mycoplasma mobile 163K]|uniref:Uncharacterized protein n=1 Tax=Mycoplasma mobile (strain ATCC 43663 / 163K / NCTC 11711) TaxID=267748 RepID=Q6KHR0_MYCM1|nr:hypothetical protein MMOB3820 [Mycoplasma mobile 163K]